MASDAETPAKKKRKASAKPAVTAAKHNAKAQKVRGSTSTNKRVASSTELIDEDLLASLVGAGWRSTYPPARLAEIKATTQKWWREYVRTQLEQPVRLLVIAEAAPWKASGNVSYVYRPADSEYDGGILGALVGGVAAADRQGGAPTAKFKKKDKASKAETLRYLGKRGVLLVDPLPMSLSYSGRKVAHSGLRAKADYPRAARQGWAEVVRQLTDAKVQLHADVVVVSSLLNSARALLVEGVGDAATPRPLPLPGGRKVTVSDVKAMCFASRAGFPTVNELTRVLGTRGLA